MSEDPAEMYANTGAFTKMNSVINYHSRSHKFTQMYDLQASPETDKTYLVVRYRCAAKDANCKKIKVHLLSCYEEQLVNAELFESGEDPFRFDGKDVLLQHGAFTHKCGDDLYDLIGRDCI